MHIIRKQIVEIDLTDRSKAEFWQDRMAMLSNDYFKGKIDQILESQFPGESRVFIEKLEIDIGAISETQSPESVALKFETALHSALAQYQDLHPSEKRIGNDATSFEKAEDHDAAIILHYLKFGFLNWKTPGSFKLRKTVNNILVEDPLRILDPLNKGSTKEPVWQRLCHLLDNRSWDIITNLLFRPKHWTKDVLERKIKLFQIFFDPRYPVKKAPSSIRTLLDICILKQYTEVLEEGMTNLQWPHVLAKIWLPLMDYTYAPNGPSTDEQVQALSEIFTLTMHDIQVVREVANRVKKERKGRPDITTHERYHPSRIGDEGLYCANMGALLLWPFLSGLFKSLKWMNVEGFLSQHHRDKAILSLFYLCNGHFPDDESGLPAIKIMCGTELEEIIDLNAIASTEERQQLDTVLENVLTNWSALKTKKVEALRSGFLQRNGAIKEGGFGWLFIPEASGIDILLQRLPWPIANIKLPWNDYLIQVNWV